jgi:uncharacterized protein with von Willebrand factor type A (vWA) domain
MEPTASQPDETGPKVLGEINKDHELSFIAELAAGDHGITFTIGKPGGGSVAILEQGLVILDPEHCKSREEQRGVAAHEGRHIFDTPSFGAMGFSSAQIRDLSKRVGMLSGRNLVEDFAVNDGVARDFPSRAGDILALYQETDPTAPAGPLVHPEVQSVIQRLGFIPRFAVALGGLLTDWAYLRRHVGFGASEQEYAQVPFSGGTSDDPDLQRFFKRNFRVAREIASTIAPPHASGAVRIDYSKARLSLFRDVIYPDIEKLFEQDVEELARKIRASIERAFENRRDDSSTERSPPSQASQATERRASPEQEGSPSESRRQAHDQLAALDDAIRKALKGLLGDEDAPSTQQQVREALAEERRAEEREKEAADIARVQESLRAALAQNMSEYDREFQLVAHAVERAYGELVQEFLLVSHHRWQSGLPRGGKVSLPHAMAYELRGDGIDKLFMRRIDPTKPDVALAFLVDASGSMSTDHRLEHARRAAVFAKELFQRLSIATCFIRFNDAPSEILPFEADIRYDDVQRALLKGCSQPEGSTRDDLALQCGAQRLSESHARTKCIVVISDAESSDVRALRETVRTLEQEGLTTLHFGLGKGTSDRAGVYTNSWGDLSLDEGSDTDFFAVFCREMCRIARDAVLRR